jgi:uncharacterized protein YneF (UPF0154 family)
MVFLIIIAVIIAFVIGYFVIRKAPRKPDEPINNNNDLRSIPPPDARTQPRRPKY